MPTQAHLPLRGILRMLAPVAFSLLFSVVCQAADAAKQSFDLPAGDAEKTLKLFTQQSGEQILYPPTKVSGIQTNAVKGEMTAGEVLYAMLDKTQLVAIRDDKTGAYTVQKAATVAEAEKNDSSRPASDRAAAKTEDGVLKLDTFEVFGRKSLNMDIQRTADDPQPYVILDRSEIERSPAANLEEFLSKRLPMNNSTFSYSQFPNSDRGNQSSINLRGLGSNQTLILVDGRRMPSAPSGGSVTVGGTINFQQADINGIPLAAVERIEVLPSTAGGIYGGGATGGVINIVLRRNYSGAEVKLTYGNTFDTDAGMRRIDISGGMSLFGGKTSVMFSAMHSDANALVTGDRDFASQARALQSANNPAAFTTLFFPPQGYTSNIASANRSNLVLKTGAALNSNITFVPLGYSGAASDNGAALVANAGKYNLALSNDANGTKRTLLNTPTIDSQSVNVRQVLGRQVEAFVDFSHYSNKGHSVNGAEVPIFAQLPISAPNNPFTTAVRVAFRGPANSPEDTVAAVTTRVAGGLIVKLPGDWMGEADYTWSKAKVQRTVKPTLTTPARVALTNGTIDITRDMNAFPVDYAPYIYTTPSDSYGPLSTILRDMTIRGSGPIAALPAGSITLSGLAEHRQERLNEFFQETKFSDAAPSVYFSPYREQKVDSAYLETRLPLLAPASRVPWVNDLSLQLSGRYDVYRTDSTNEAAINIPNRAGPLPVSSGRTDVRVSRSSFTAGLKYSPTQSVTLRTSFGTGFLPPSLSQIVPEIPYVSSDVVVDPKRGNISALTDEIPFSYGGNPNLKPEESESLSAGIILNLQGRKDLRVSIDYTRITKKNEIATLTSAQTVVLEDRLPGRVSRAPLTAQDQALGYTAGAITAIDGSYVNIAGTRVDALDFQVDYTVHTTSLGDWAFYGIGTYSSRFERQTLPGEAAIDSAGYLYDGGPVKWRANGGVNVTRGVWSFGWNVQYFHSYSVLSADPVIAAASNPNAILNQGSDRIDAQYYHDLYVGHKFGNRDDRWGNLVRGTQLIVGVQNVFNAKPPIIAGTTMLNGYSTLGDPRLARYTISLKRSF